MKKRGYICLTELPVLDKVHLHKNNAFSVYHFVLFIYFVFKLEDTTHHQLSTEGPD